MIETWYISGFGNLWFGLKWGKDNRLIFVQFHIFKLKEVDNEPVLSPILLIEIILVLYLCELSIIASSNASKNYTEKCKSSNTNKGVVKCSWEACSTIPGYIFNFKCRVVFFLFRAWVCGWRTSAVLCKQVKAVTSLWAGQQTKFPKHPDRRSTLR